MPHAARSGRAICSALLAACILVPQAALAGDAAASVSFKRAIFEQERASTDVRKVADWVVHSRDNHAGDDARLPFAILDKKDARVYVFNPEGRLLGAAAALL